MLSSFKRMSKGSKSHLTIYSKERRGFHNERNFAFWPSEYKIDLCTINEALALNTGFRIQKPS